MGVRFECPAGHKLHVKAELAGKRGICPECGAKFIVPSFSGQRVPEDNGVAATSAAGPPPLRQSAAPATSVEAAAWYIRPASGGQFGPANDEVFAQWIAEGRVSADSWVWRNGWADWQSGSEALREFGARPPMPASVPTPDFDLEDEEDDSSLASSAAGINLAPAATIVAIQTAHQVEASSADLRRAEMQRRKQQVRTFSIVLGVIALAMLIALAFVLTRGGETPPTEDSNPPAAAPPAAASAPVAAEPMEPAEPAAE